VRPLLVLRPEPGAARTAQAARLLGLEALVAPLFTVRPLAWQPPDPGAFDAVLLTSGHAARLGGAGLTSFLRHPCYATGEATAAAAREAGFADVRVGAGDGAAALALLAADGHSRALHLCGRDHVALEMGGVSVERRAVHASEAERALPKDAHDAMAQGCVALIHSPRAAAVLDRLAVHRGRVLLAAISPAAAAAAGSGWGAVEAAAAPRDEALLELASKLCKTGGVTGSSEVEDGA
jgi:uroporphyrinogen-III synthase